MRIFVGTFELKLRSYDIEVACQLPSSLVDFNSLIVYICSEYGIAFRDKASHARSHLVF